MSTIWGSKSEKFAIFPISGEKYCDEFWPKSQLKPWPEPQTTAQAVA
jgi:hypothetical protein